MASLNYPYSFTNGTTADATQVNSNFAAAKTFVEANVVQTDGSVQAGTTAIADGAITVAKLAASVRPGLVHLNTTTMSNETQKIISNVFTGTYRKYKVVVSNYIPTATVSGPLFTLATGGVANTASSFTGTQLNTYALNTADWGPYRDQNVSYLQLGDSFNPGGCFIEMEIDCPALSNAYTFVKYETVFPTENAVYIGVWNGYYIFKNTTVFDGFKFYGGANANATISVYGYVI